jgi:hypothetical protein
MRSLLTLLVLIIALVAGTPARAGDLTPIELRDARKLYIAKCTRCHKLYDPKKYSDQKWSTWMEKMNKKAKLKPDQAALLSQYLATLRHPPTTNAVTPPSQR